MWRKQCRLLKKLNHLGNTSTYVEKTYYCTEYLEAEYQHLHVCGENVPVPKGDGPDKETPPRMWRKLQNRILDTPGVRNTSTYVEKTLLEQTVSKSVSKHLHVCGENL